MLFTFYSTNHADHTPGVQECFTIYLHLIDCSVQTSQITYHPIIILSEVKTQTLAVYLVGGKKGHNT